MKLKRSVLRRIEDIEARVTDGSGLVPHTPQWLAFWQGELKKFEAGHEHKRLTLEVVRAIMQATPDSPETA